MNNKPLIKVMVKGLEENSVEALLDSLLEYRLSGNNSPEIMDDPAFTSLRDKAIDLQKVINSLLPSEESIKTFMSLCDTTTLMYSRSQDITYKRGFKDGIKLYRMLTGEIEW